MSEEKFNLFLNYIKKQFLCCVPVNKINWSFTSFLDWDSQELVINETTNSNLILKFPVKISYQKAFLKYLIGELEKQSTDVNDVVYDAFGRLMALPEPDRCYKHYLWDFESSSVITLQENVNFISDGTTGLCSWQAAVALSEWLRINNTIFRGKTVLELGSGTGLTGLSACLFCDLKQYYFSDCHNSVLSLLSDNIKLNFSDILNNSENKSSVMNGVINNTKQFKVLNLPWENITSGAALNLEVDILIAADVVYDSSLFPSLVGSIEKFLSVRSCVAYLACTERNPETLKEFLELLEEKLLIIEKIDSPEPDVFCWDTSTPIHFYKIYRKPIGGIAARTD